MKRFERLEHVRGLVLDTMPAPERTGERRDTIGNMLGAAALASMLAKRRKLDSEIAAIAGLLHDYYAYRIGVREFPGPNSAEAVRPILRDARLFEDEELTVILRSIFHQDDRGRMHGPYEEIVKDAIVLHRHLQPTGCRCDETDRNRLRNVLAELRIPGELPEAEAAIDRGQAARDDEGRRLRLADCAERLAGQNITGDPADERFREICKYWPDTDIFGVLKAKWCAAFVYYCCMQVGIRMPIRYPNGRYRFAGVGAWLDWALLPETGFLHRDGEDGFRPERGDLVVYDKLLSDDPHDHIGIVLARGDRTVEVAEGNKDNLNFSAVLTRERGHCILGYIRIDDGYRYNWSGHYTPNIR